ncbi:molybdopterin oxidoreductase family protein [Arenimonas fontis]|uniref:Molybdopterin-dependent oxidoreductase n=1 Tax=Arenimonas fontis TaxID=2608255 RepID=A0A5B2Z9C8_9GAMM|nr:molybdopterin oxidoreductase family protein [Arenimonas fontis]KAA2284609.1 molybdopterin-dependent oxidoreductase [Arenimonas fontis]
MTEPALDLQRPVGDQVRRTTCYMCACRCGINVHLRDGQVRYIEGNPEHPVNRGVLCAKGSAGIMQHYSPARLRKPMKRVGERGENRFQEISWDEALEIATAWLREAREKDPDRLAFFTGRDQSQALTGWWAQQYGTVNYAAHGGFCSVNMAAGGLYTLGGSFWEFGEPDWEHTKYLMLWGVAEDHDSNPIKLGLGRLKARGAKIVAVNPVRTGYGAVADEWLGIRPGSDGLLAFALIHELLKADRVDLDYLVRYTNAHWLVLDNPGGADDGLFARDGQGRVLCWDRGSPPPGPLSGEGEGENDQGPSPPAGNGPGRGGAPAPAEATGIHPAIVGDYTLPDGRRARPVFHLVAERYLDPQYAPEAVAGRCGLPAATIRRLAREIAAAAFDDPVVIEQPWTDAHGVEHPRMLGRPVAFHAMRGISAHSNGFHTCRALHLLQLLLGAVDTPGSFRFQPPYPRPIPPANRPGKTRKPDGTLGAAPLGFIHGPEDLLVDEQGQPRRIDHAYSWRYPLAVHGMMHTLIRNAWAADPAPVDVLFLFMANMAWNSAMNTRETIAWLTDRREDGNYRIPRIIYSDAYASEMVAYADLVLPDTTYLERFDAISLLDRPISDADAAADAIRWPVLDPAAQAEGRDVRGFQSVLIELGARLGLPGLVREDGSPRYRDYADYIVHHERAPGVGLLAGWRGDGSAHGKGAPNPRQLEHYQRHGGFWQAPVPARGRYFKMANADYLRWARDMGFIGDDAPIVLQLYSETLQKFRLAARGHGPVRPPAAERARVERYFDPLPFWYEPFEGEQAGHVRYPLSAITQRPPFMYHAWGSQNAWLRQIMTRNLLFLHPDTAARLGLADGDWAHVDSHHGRITVPVKLAGNVQPDTVWTWNAIGKRRGAWKLAPEAPEGRQGFLLNHLISDRLPDAAAANADPVTGQAAWFDLRVAVSRAEAPADGAQPQFPALGDGPAEAGPLRYGARFRSR